jgi:hypothetical protein
VEVTQPVQIGDVAVVELVHIGQIPLVAVPV